MEKFLNDNKPDGYFTFKNKLIFLIIQESNALDTERLGKNPRKRIKSEVRKN